jgi:hypothetical protein
MASPNPYRTVPERKAFLLRIDPQLLSAMQKWAGDDLRSLNGQIEFVLRDALTRAGRLKTKPPR